MSSNNPALDHQQAVFEANWMTIMGGTHDEYVDAAAALVDTAVDSHTGYALAMGIAAVIELLVQKITELDRVPVTAHQPRSQAEYDDFILAAQFMQANHARGEITAPADIMPDTLRIFRDFEEDETGKRIAGLYAFLFESWREMGQQLVQALKDKEATA